MGGPTSCSTAVTIEDDELGVTGVTVTSTPRKAADMDLFLAHFADTLDQDAHAVMMCDGAGWHDERALSAA